MRVSKLFLIAAGTLSLALALPAQASRQDVDGAVARLENHADSLRRDLILPPKKGHAVKADLRAQIRSAEQEIARLEEGGELDRERIAALLGEPLETQSLAERVAQRADRRQEVLERRLRPGGPKLGRLGRLAVQRDLEQLDGLIAALESGREVDPARIDELLGVMIADARKSPAERLREGEIRLATLERKLAVGPKLGARGRQQLEEEIEQLDRLIERLESEVDRQ